MPVGVRRQHDGAVPQQVLDVLEAEALGQQERGRGMAQVMETGVWELGASEGLVEGPEIVAAWCGFPSIVAKT